MKPVSIRRWDGVRTATDDVPFEFTPEVPVLNPRRIRLSDRRIRQSLRRLPVRPPPTAEAGDLAGAIGRVIHRLRLRAGLSQQEFADQLGVDRSAVSRWERGQRCPTLVHLTLLGELAGCRASSLLAEAEDLMRPPRGTDRFADGVGPDDPDQVNVLDRGH